LSTEISFQGPTSLCRGEGNTTEGAIAMPSEALAVSQVLSMPRSFTRGSREILEASGGPTPSGRVEQGCEKVVCLGERASDGGEPFAQRLCVYSLLTICACSTQFAFFYFQSI